MILCIAGLFEIIASLLSVIDFCLRDKLKRLVGKLNG